jgi:hypothetical protein
MRISRGPTLAPDSYYAVTNRAVGMPSERPFGRMEKKEFIRRARKLVRFFCVDLLSVVCMSTHYHIVLYTHLLPPTREEVIRRWRDRYGSDPDLGENDENLPAIVERMTSLSAFIGELQKGFTDWYNRTRDPDPKVVRRGPLWSGRYKSVRLEGGSATVAAIVYCELNPVRAGIAISARSYAYSSWGLWGRCDRPASLPRLLFHMRRLLGPSYRRMGWAELFHWLEAEMARWLARDALKKGNARLARRLLAGTACVPGCNCRILHFSRSIALGSQEFVDSIAAKTGRKAVRLSEDETGEVLYGLSRPRAVG